MNNQNAGTVIGPILIPTDGSHTSLFVKELPGWPPGTFSEAFNGTANLTLNVPNQQSATQALLEPLFIAVVGSGNEFRLTAAPHTVVGPDIPSYQNLLPSVGAN